MYSHAIAQNCVLFLIKDIWLNSFGIILYFEGWGEIMDYLTTIYEMHLFKTLQTPRNIPKEP